MRTFAVLFGSAAVLTAAAAPAAAQCQSSAPSTVVAGMQVERDIVDTAVAAGQFKTLATALKAAGLVDALKGDGPFTVFAPTDDAFAKLPAGTVQSLLEPGNRDKLAAILKYHVVPGRLNAAHVKQQSSLQALAGGALDLSATSDGLKIGGARIVKADVGASNGVIHVIDSVMMPPAGDIIDIASANDSFSTLVTAVKTAGLVEALQGEGPFTVFAPTDAAFASLGSDAVADLLKPENRAKLTKILKYHVVPGRVLARDVVKIDSAATLAGQAVKVKAGHEGVMIGNANVVKTDILATNGVIHVIDSVLLPN